MSVWSNVLVCVCISAFVFLSAHLGLFFSFFLCKPPSDHFSLHKKNRIAYLCWIPNALVATPPQAWLRDVSALEAFLILHLSDSTQACCNLTCPPHRFPQVPHVLLQSIVFQAITFDRTGQGHKH
ncbi:hypothetical protein HJG60_010257 [Phyllostomus discolor]|uniref:Uncharacterized protein n=1 Tax=Phyllostomus discolor TaxID=89673 RepID=A0A834AWE5_9CHIR|nr:hypothetical protein HJG60_010257 [Phyllostomus discolor]